MQQIRARLLAARTLPFLDEAQHDGLITVDNFFGLPASVTPLLDYMRALVSPPCFAELRQPQFYFAKHTWHYELTARIGDRTHKFSVSDAHGYHDFIDDILAPLTSCKAFARAFDRAKKGSSD
jgi:hypothetical protein